jgi:hypothetical protein
MLMVVIYLFIIYYYFEDRIYILGGTLNDQTALNTVELYSIDNGGQVLPYTMAIGDYNYACVVIV